MIPYKWFWKRQITLPALPGHTVLRTWRCSLCSWTLHERMCKATTPVIKERCVTSHWRQLGKFTWFGTDFVAYMFSTKLFSHVIIRIDHGCLGVMSTTPKWFVILWGHPSSCSLRTSQCRTTNHSGGLDLTPSQSLNSLRLSDAYMHQ